MSNVAKLTGCTLSMINHQYKSRKT